MRLHGSPATPRRVTPRNTTTTARDFQLPGYDVEQVLEVATSSAKGATEIRRAAVGLARDSAVAFNLLLHRYAKEYSFKVG